MTEVKAVYGDLVDNFVCVQCGRIVGEVRRLGDLRILYIGGNPVRTFYANCGACGGGIEWSIGEQTMRRLIEHVLQLRNGV